MKYTIGWALKRELREELVIQIIPYILLAILIIGFGFAFHTALWKQGRKDCLTAQYDEINYNRQVSPKMNEYCVTKYNIQFLP